jgi:ribosomal protein L11
MAKNIKAKVKLQIEAGKANPAPPVGPALAPTGINMAEFCQKFNADTKENMGFKIPVEIIVYDDRSYDYILKEPPVSQLIKKAIIITPSKLKNFLHPVSIKSQPIVLPTYTKIIPPNIIDTKTLII